MKIVTGYTGKPHVTSIQEASLNMGVAGCDDYVLSVGSRLKAEIVTNNSVKILDGDLMMQGHHALIEADSYEEVTINNGTQGMKRNDLIVARYTKDSISGVEDIQIAVAEGTPGVQGTDPAIVTGDIRSGVMRHEMPLYRVELDGLNIVKLTGVFQVLGSVAELNSNLTLRNKLLWSGEWVKGQTISIPNFDKYVLFKLSMAAQGTYILAVRGTYFRGTGGFVSDTPAVITFHMGADVSGNNVKLINCVSLVHNTGSNHTNYKEQTITSITGVI